MNVPFKITRLTGELLESAVANPPEPHRHDHEELVILTGGMPVHLVDFTSTRLEAPMIIYIAKGKVHSIHPDPNTRGWVIRYTNELIPESRFNFYSNFSDQVNFQLNPDYCASDLNALCEMMLKEYKSPKPNYEIVRHLLSAVLARIDADRKQDDQESSPAGSMYTTTFNSFLKILENNYKRPEGVDFYADKLNMGSRNLNLISQAIFGKSITEIIETRKLIEARRLLLNSDLTVANIAYELGYNENSYFTRVFRKKTGVTPTAFREKMQNIIS
ncbi:MAG: helix-turn-helix domain-containing protein [Bacteroidetes bacterium]|nr:helix-turn-helix domain-containing protein [Bacteroidota bacterium]